jgi:hypothetical protein
MSDNIKEDPGVDRETVAVYQTRRYNVPESLEWKEPDRLRLLDRLEPLAQSSRISQ